VRLLIVDDEAPARARLRRLLQDVPGITRVIEAENAAQALASLRLESVDAALLDIEMPGTDGLTLALELPPEVLCVFCTAFDDYAVRAFDLNAVDYLLKPFHPERLAQAVARLRQRLAARPAARGSLLTALQQLQPVAGHWLVERRGSLHKLALETVEWVAAADNYIEFHAPPQCDLERCSLASFLAHPAAADFVRVHRCHAVNAHHISAITPLPNGEASLTLRCGQSLRVSRGYRGALA
jgi:two-component system LytT family response regulator